VEECESQVRRFPRQEAKSSHRRSGAILASGTVNSSGGNNEPHAPSRHSMQVMRQIEVFSATGPINPTFSGRPRAEVC
jgi:hypothetical protein